MDTFIDEIKALSTQDLSFMLNEQQDFYSNAQIAIMQKELSSRTGGSFTADDAIKKETEYSQVAQKKLQEKRRIEEQRKATLNAKLNNLREKGYKGYYEYTTISLVDKNGMLAANKLTELLNRYALDGWRLVSAYANELGHNSRSVGVGGFSSGTNETVDQHILIMERYVRL